jgi:hypothetical protein
MDVLRFIFVVPAVGLFVFWLAAAMASHRPPADVKIIAELRYSRGIRLFALLLVLIIAGLMIFVIWFLPWLPSRQPYLIAAGCTFLGLNLLGGLLLLETARVRLYLTEDALIGDSPWRRRRTIRWQEVENVTYSPLNRWFTVIGPGGRAIRASRSLAGLSDLLEMLKTRVPPERRTQVSRFLS